MGKTISIIGSSKGGRITGKGKIKTRKLDFEDVYFVKELKFNLFSVSQMCDKKNSVLFTETECLILSPDFKLPDENQVMLKIPRKDNMYSFDLKNVVPSKGLTCLIAKATNDESNMWHRRLGHINFKTMNKLVKGNLVRGLPSKIFENDHSCVACQKGKQHKASCKSKLVTSVSQPLQILHMDLFGPIFVKSIMGKICDNGTEFKNYDMNQFCGIKGIKREFSNARTPQQNGVAERKNRTFIEAARTMLADSLLPIPFWAEAVNTACYVQNRVLVTKPHNKTPYELLIGRTPIISFMRPFGCPVTILNTLDHLGKFNRKVDVGFLVGYSINNKAFRVFNSRTKKVEENLHVNFLKINQMLQEVDHNGCLETNSDAGQAGKENVSDQEYILLPSLHTSSNVPSNSKKDESSPKDDAGKKNEVKDSTKEDTANLQDTGIFRSAYDDEYVGAEADLSNLETNMSVSPIPTTRIRKDHPKAQIIREVDYAVQTRRIHKQNKAGLITFINKQRRTNHKDFQNCRSYAGRASLVQTTECLDTGGFTPWKEGHWLVAQGYRQEEGVDYDGVFAPVARIEAIWLFLAFASYMDFTVYQMDVKSAFLYGTIEEEKTLFIKKIKNDILLVQVYVDDIFFGSTKESLSTEFEQLMHKRFQMSSIGELTFFLGLQVEHRKDGIFLSQDKYVYDILKKFGFSNVKTASTPMETHKPLSQDTAGIAVDVSDETVHKELGNRMKRAATTASSLEAE
ncbi:putative ribonuclease H-like domain-containing protein [Tanacetum coccineum]